MKIRTLKSTDRASIESCLRAATFSDDEITVALELVDDALSNTDSDYWFYIAVEGTQLLGYICYGPTPMTVASYDLYWIVTHPTARRRRIASTLIETMEKNLLKRGATGIRIETSQLYSLARRLYEHMNYKEIAIIQDFYQPGDDLVTYYKRLPYRAH